MISIYNPNTRTELVFTSNSEKKYIMIQATVVWFFFSIKKNRLEIFQFLFAIVYFIKVDKIVYKMNTHQIYLNIIFLKIIVNLVIEILSSYILNHLFFNRALHLKRIQSKNGHIHTVFLIIFYCFKTVYSLPSFKHFYF